MKVLELFAGSRSFSRVAEEHGFETYATDIKPFENMNQVCDIFDFDIERMIDEFGKPDVIWASPPCTAFSVSAIGKHWHENHTPKTEHAMKGMEIVEHTIKIIRHLKPKRIYIENPRGKLRKLTLIQKENFFRNTVWYCQYGDKRAKPTDIWTNDWYWAPKPVCFPNNPNCEHIRAPRGSMTGTQGIKNRPHYPGDYLRSVVPKELCGEIIKGIQIGLQKE